MKLNDKMQRSKTFKMTNQNAEHSMLSFNHNNTNNTKRNETETLTDYINMNHTV